MKRSLVLLLLGILALGLQGGIATFVPRAYCPDFGLLVVLAIGLQWQGLAGGALISATLGFAADLLSGSLMGVHTLLRILTFCCASLARRQLNLQGAIPLAFFAAVVTFAYALGVFGLTRFFIAHASIGWADLGILIPHALVNAALAPVVAACVARVWGYLGDNDGYRGGLTLESQRSNQ